MSFSLPRRTLGAAAALAVIALVAGCATGGAAKQAAGTASGGTHTIAHARGTTAVPEDPQRVVTLEPLELDTAVALGVQPVGAAVASNVAGVPEYLDVDGVQAVGTVPEPNLEAIAALKPDLILGTESRHSKLYKQLAAIAPTVFMQTQADPWQENVLLVGAALNQKADAQRLLDGFNDRCAEIKREADITGKTANFVRPRDETTLNLYGPESFAGSALGCVGLTIPEQDWEDGLQADISPENIADAAADYVFVPTSDVTDTSTVPAAIRQNKASFPSVTLVDTSYWIAGVGPKGGGLVLDDLEQFLSTQQ